MKRSFLLIRHGATKLNHGSDTSVDRIRGWMDIPLSDEGRKETTKLADKMKGTDLDLIVSSDLERARDTALILAGMLSIPEIAETKTLRPWNVGQLAGQTTDKALPVMEDFIRNKPDDAVPGGEPFNAFRKRAFSGIFSMLASHTGRKIGMVTHHRVERLLKAWQAAGSPDDLDLDLDVFIERGEPTAHADAMTVRMPSWTSAMPEIPSGVGRSPAYPLPAAAAGAHGVDADPVRSRAAMRARMMPGRRR